MPDIKAQNEKALASVKAIYDAAEQAKADASRAKDAADDAADAAELADEKADEAKTSALAAGKAADGALTQLSLVEDVVGVITWITKHGTYSLTQDTEAVPGKHYFTKTGDSYNLVINPASDPAQAGYYELTGVDEAVSNYVASHLSLTDQGLWVTKDNNAYKILLASDGMKVYDNLGNLVATFGESITFASDRPQYIGGENAYIVFYDSDNDGVPDAINIGGSSVSIMGSKSLSELLSDVDTSKTALTDTQTVWYRTASTTKPSAPSSWVTSGSVTSNQWIKVKPPGASLAADLYYCIQSRTITQKAAGIFTNSAVYKYEAGEYEISGLADELAALKTKPLNLLKESLIADKGVRTSNGMSIEYEGHGYWHLYGTLEANKSATFKLYTLSISKDTNNKNDVSFSITGDLSRAEGLQLYFSSQVGTQIQVIKRNFSDGDVTFELAQRNLYNISVYLPSQTEERSYDGRFRYMLEWGSTPCGSWSPAPEDIGLEDEAAAKVATNYLSQDNTGIMVYDGSENASQTPSTATSRNVFIDSNSVDIRDGKNVLASFGEEVVIGQEDDAHMKITSTTIEGITEEKNSLFEVDLHGGIYAQAMDLVSAIDEYVDMFSDEEYMGGGGTLNVPSTDTLNLTEYPEDQDVTVRGQIYAQFAFMTADVECSSQSAYDPAIIKSTEQFITVFTVIFTIAKSVAADPGISPTSSIAIDPCIVTFDIDGTNLDVSINTYIRNNRFEVEITAVNENIWDIGAKFDRITYDVTMRSSALTVGTKSGERAAFTGTIGVGLKAETPGQLSVGSFNETYAGTEELFSVGNGLGESARSTAFLITETGDEYIGLDVSIDEVSGYASGKHADLYNGIVSGGYNDAFDLTQAKGSMILANLQKLLAKAIAATPVGMIEMFGGYAPPDGWLLCDGSEVSRTEYAALFNVIGTDYGDGDGTETFNVPNMIDRMPVGVGNTYDLNSKGGSPYLQAHTHGFTQPKIPNHVHSFTGNRDAAAALSGSNPSPRGDVMRLGSGNTWNITSSSGGGGACTGGAVGAVSGATTGTGGNMPPYIGVNFIIYTGVLMSEGE